MMTRVASAMLSMRWLTIACAGVPPEDRQDKMSIACSKQCNPGSLIAKHGGITTLSGGEKHQTSWALSEAKL
jgi:hypothetical protein